MCPAGDAACSAAAQLRNMRRRWRLRRSGICGAYLRRACGARPVGAEAARPGDAAGRGNDQSGFPVGAVISHALRAAPLRGFVRRRGRVVLAAERRARDRWAADRRAGDRLGVGQLSSLARKARRFFCRSDTIIQLMPAAISMQAMGLLRTCSRRVRRNCEPAPSRLASRTSRSTISPGETRKLSSSRSRSRRQR